MDTCQSATKDKRKGGSNNVNPVQTHSMETRSKAQEKAMTKRRKQETDPLKMGHILEIVLGFLDADSIKAARQVNPLWGVEGAKILITKCYVKIPSKVQAARSSTKGTNMDEFKLFLSHKSKDFIIPNIIVGATGDGELWQSLGVLGYQVKSLKFNFVDEKAEMLHNLLDLLPNLKYLKFEESTLYENRRAIIKVIISAMSKKEKHERSLTISPMAVGLNNEEELKEMEKLADYKNVTFEELALHFHNITDSNFHARTIHAMSKILTTSQNVLKKLSLYSCAFHLSLIKFPFMPALVHMDLNFWSHSGSVRFSTPFRFSENVPNLQEINIDYSSNLRVLFCNLLRSIGTAPSVKRVYCYEDYSYNSVDILLETFPNTEEFEETCDSETKFRSLWKKGKNLKKLTLTIPATHKTKSLDLDCLLTGFDAETVNKIRETPNLDPFTLEELEKLKVNPSISNLKELEELSIYLNPSWATEVPKRMLTVAAKYEINLLPKKPRIIISLENIEGLKSAFEEVSKLPNFTFQFRG